MCHDLGESDSTFVFDENIIKEALKRIYSEDFNPLTDIEENLFDETCKKFNFATDKGFSMSDYNPGEDFIREIKYNNAVFSAFRVHRMQNDIAAKLLDENGKLKTFSRFAKDVTPITDHHVKQWMRTEYDTAIIRAHQAADWKRFEAEKDVLPNLEWMPTTSITPGEDHRPFWGTIQPVDAPFWGSHRPGDRWNCKCRLQATDKNHTPLPPSPQGEGAGVRSQPGLENNPATSGMIYSFAHPFFTAGYLAYKKLAPIVEKFVDKQLTVAAVKNLKKVRASLPLHNGLKIAGKEFKTGSIIILRRTLDDVLEHNISDKWMKLWLSTFNPEKDIKKWKYEGWAFPREVNGKKKHPEASRFHYYSLKLNGKTYWANVKVHKLMKGEVLYTIEKNKPSDLIKGEFKE